MEYCVACKRKLVPIGKSRKNGKSHTDWPGRQYHKACWKELAWQNTYFTVDYDRKDDAKGCGAKWGRRGKKVVFSKRCCIYEYVEYEVPKVL